MQDILLLILRLKSTKLYIHHYLQLSTTPYFLNLLVETATKRLCIALKVQNSIKSFPEWSNCSGIKTIKPIHDLFLFEDDLFRYEAEIIRNEPCASMGQNNIQTMKEFSHSILSGDVYHKARICGLRSGWSNTRSKTLIIGYQSTRSERKSSSYRIHPGGEPAGSVVFNKRKSSQ